MNLALHLLGIDPPANPVSLVPQHAPATRNPITQADVLSAIRECPSTAAEIAAEYGASTKTVGNHIARLHAARLVMPVGMAEAWNRPARIWGPA
ncbi:MAG: ArsR family transcriptional regulator [Opitutaceae bacterium]|nr:ArsR family transcriptional regulator [Opitutaceae bacterium]